VPRNSNASSPEETGTGNMKKVYLLQLLFVLAFSWTFGTASLQNNFRNITEHDDDDSIPVFWHVPKSGGTSMKDLAHCLHLVVASQSGKASGYPASLEVLYSNGRSFVNVDVSSKKGIKEAHDLGFSSNDHLEEIILTPHLYEAAKNLLDPEHPGALFALLRHPVERAVSLFYYLQHASWEPTYAPELKNMTIEEYYQTGHVERNWMTRFLIGKERDELTRKDMEYAKRLLVQKMLVGLTDHMGESLRRVGLYFGWEHDRSEWYGCVGKFTKKGSNSYKHPKVKPGSSAWDAIAEINAYDMELYEYAVEVYENQAALFRKKKD
jgi:hypothetical protein